MTGAAFRLQVIHGIGPELGAYGFERAVFEREYGVVPAAHDAEFAPYDERSLFVSVTDADGGVVGHMRLIRPGADPERQPVKTLVEAAAEPWSLDVPRAVRAAGIEVRHAWDVGTLAVDRGIGRARSTVLGALYHALVRLAERNDIRYLLMTVDERVRSTLRLVGLPTVALPGARPLPFCGSAASTPVWGNCADMLTQQRRENPEAHQLIRQGVGLADVELPGLEAFDVVPREPAPAARPAGRSEPAFRLRSTARS